MDGKVVISTALDNTGLTKGVNNISGSFGGLKNVLGKLTGVIGSAFAVGKIVQFGKESSQAARDLTDALVGLRSVVDGNGRSFSDAQAFIDEFTADGLVPATNAVAAYKNLLQRGYDDSQIKSVMNALKDASAYGRQSSYTMGEAVQSATEGLKNENSVLVDNAGVTKNVAKMWEDYAKSIGTTAANLTQQQKIQAEVTGILEESKFQTGDAAKVAGTLSGQLQQLSFNFNNLKVAIGNAINPILQAVLPTINTAVAAFTRLANSIASVMGALFGSAKVTSSAATGAAAVADANNGMAKSAETGAKAQKNLAKGVSAAGKAAKKSLAGFDELNTLQENISSGGGGGASGGPGGVGTGGATSTGTVEVSSEVTDTLSPKLQAILDKINELIAPLKEIDLGPLKNSFEVLGNSIARFGKMIGEHLEWYWFNVLVPLAEWTIEEAAPAAVNLLAGAFDLLTAAIDPVLTGLENLWMKMQPAIDWIRGTAIVVIETITQRFRDFASLLEEKSPEIEEIFSNIGTIMSEAWQNAEPFLTGMREGLLLLSDAVAEFATAKIGLLIDNLAGLSSILAGFSSGNWDLVWQGMSEIAVGKAEYIEKRTGKMFEKLGIDISGFSEEVDRSMQDIGQFFSNAWDFIEDTWEGAGQWFQTKVVTPIQTFFAPLKQWFSDLFGNIWNTVEDVFYNIEEIGSGCKQVLETAWDQFWENLETWADDTWTGIQDVFGSVAEWFGDTFGDAWEEVKKVFSSGGKVFDGIKEGIVSSFKSIVNKLISGINRVVARPFEGLNTAIRKIKSVEVLGLKPFSGLSTISVPSIPYLARGAVLPANKPFMAVVGDQRHGTNIEAPLSTIQEAVAAVMGDQVAAMMAGFNALLEENQRLRQVVENIELGDSTIGQAAERYQLSEAITLGV